MKLKFFTLSAVTLLLSSATSHAGHGYFTQLGRIIGYGISDGYHAQRDCLIADQPCSSCSPVQQPVAPQQMMPQQMMPQPIADPASTQWAPPPFQPVGYPTGYHPVAPAYQPRYQPYPPSYGQPVMPPVASPYHNPGARWKWPAN